MASDRCGVSGLPRRVDKVVRVRPVEEQVGGFYIVYSDVHVSERLREKVVDLSCYIQNVAHAESHTYT